LFLLLYKEYKEAEGIYQELLKKYGVVNPALTGVGITSIQKGP
jgi:hypothetical protein